ncbi:MAG: (2Fe-2S)-binding protein [Thermoleophilia bacterium]
MAHALNLTVNGKQHSLLVDADQSLREVLREHLGLTGTKVACSMGVCGACTVIVNDRAVKSCLVPALQVNGKVVLTVEGLSDGNGLHPLQQAFIDQFAVQCGYCTPGMLMTAKALLDENPSPSEDFIRERLHGNICRCTGYTKIIAAIQDAAGRLDAREEKARGGR